MGSTRGDIQQQSVLTPEQQTTLSKLLQDFDPAQVTNMFQDSVAAPARQQFQQQTLPGIQERFISEGAPNSGAAQRTAYGAGANMESGLSGQLAQLLYQAQQGTENRQASLSTTPTMATYQNNNTSPLASLLSPIATGAGYAVGGPAGGAAARAATGMFSGKNNKTSTSVPTTTGSMIDPRITNMNFGQF